jgi:hypothetical protein
LHRWEIRARIGFALNERDLAGDPPSDFQLLACQQTAGCTTDFSIALAYPKSITAGPFQLDCAKPTLKITSHRSCFD